MIPSTPSPGISGDAGEKTEERGRVSCPNKPSSLSAPDGLPFDHPALEIAQSLAHHRVLCRISIVPSVPFLPSDSSPDGRVVFWSLNGKDFCYRRFADPLHSAGYLDPLATIDRPGASSFPLGEIEGVEYTFFRLSEAGLLWLHRAQMHQAARHLMQIEGMAREKSEAGGLQSSSSSPKGATA